MANKKKEQEKKEIKWEKNIGNGSYSSSAPISVKNELKTRLFGLLIILSAGIIGFLIYIIVELFN